MPDEKALGFSGLQHLWEKISAKLSKKQDTITGTQGQVVGFDAQGRPVAQAAPDTGVVSFNGRKGAVVPTADDYGASDIKFADGQTFQQKYDAGQLDGNPGAPGKSAFQSAQENGYTGSEAEFYAALVALKDGPFLPLNGGTMEPGAIIRADGRLAITTLPPPTRSNGLVSALEMRDDGFRFCRLFTDNLIRHWGLFGDDESMFLGYRYGEVSDISGLMVKPFSGDGTNMVAETSIWAGKDMIISVTDAGAQYFGPVDQDKNLVTKEYADALLPRATQVTLTAAGWNASAKTQTVTVSGVLADETKQLIMPMPAVASQNAYAAAGIACTAQAANSLTFKCLTVPTEDIMVYVAVQGVA